MWLIWTILIGILAGFLAGQVVKGRGMGVLVDLLVGIVGSVLGGWIFGILGLAAYGLIGRLVVAFVGAVVLLLLVRALKRA
ncbi:MAG TPA: GlsB/YeaQ/YmgE family stress response membrane protein [Candidatus Acidoferrum sp.]|nr:GlsB/YeaQ/YmgE family stress response membrane protein [Candidatus Acidoferrum sp.]